MEELIKISIYEDKDLLDSKINFYDIKESNISTKINLYGILKILTKNLEKDILKDINESRGINDE